MSRLESVFHRLVFPHPNMLVQDTGVGDPLLQVFHPPLPNVPQLAAR